MKPNQCKKLIASELEQRQLPYTKLTAKTVSFVDLARSSCVFVTVHGWQASPAWDELQKIAVNNGFRILAAGHFN